MVLGSQFILTGCGRNSELVEVTSNNMKDTYWKWVDTSPGDGTEEFCYGYLDSTGVFYEKGYAHKNNKVLKKYVNEYETTWEVISHKGRLCVKISEIIGGYEVNTFMLGDKDGNLNNFEYSMYLPGESNYAEGKNYPMTILSKEEYEDAIDKEEEALSGSDDVNSITQKSSSFTNKFGSETTKCAHSGCQNYIASSGDTNCCVKHSNKCLNCKKYIDEDAMYCMDCIKNSLKN